MNLTGLRYEVRRVRLELGLGLQLGLGLGLGPWLFPGVAWGRVSNAGLGQGFLPQVPAPKAHPPHPPDPH